jgi:hypothetical protein
MLKLLLTLDCEDFINPRSTFALRRVLELLQKYDLRAIFFLTGHVCEKLMSFPEISNLLEEQEIGYHSTAHSVHPNLFQYTDVENYHVARHISLDRETAHINPLTGEAEEKGGFLLLKDLFPNNKIVSFRAPGFCWSPPHLEALEELGIRFDFSTNLSPTPIRYGKTTFYPFSEWGYSFKPIAFSLLRSLKMFRRAFLGMFSQYVVLMFHPDNFVNKRGWDIIYWNGNPKQLCMVVPKSQKEAQDMLRGFELFLKRINFLAKKGILEVTPPLQEGKIKTSFTEADILRVYRRSISWPKKFFNYQPKFLLSHFFKYFNIKSGHY